MRRLRYRALPATGPGIIPARGTLVDLLLEMPYKFMQVEPNNILPPLDVLNDLLAIGEVDAAMSGGVRWKPFAVTPEEYAELIAAMEALPVEQGSNWLTGRPNVPYRFVLPPSGTHTYKAWQEWRSNLRHEIYKEFIEIDPTTGSIISMTYHEPDWRASETSADVTEAGPTVTQTTAVGENWLKPDAICFYRVRDPYGKFSNFAPYPIEIDGKVWPTAEHYFQAQKFVGTDHEEAIRVATSPTIAARMGRSRRWPLRPDWEAVKDDVMRTAVRSKFRLHPRLRDLLLSTGDAPIVEHTAKDSYWGDGGDGSGKNMLGRILMEVRAEQRG